MKIGNKLIKILEYNCGNNKGPDGAGRDRTFITLRIGQYHESSFNYLCSILLGLCLEYILSFRYEMPFKKPKKRLKFSHI